MDDIAIDMDVIRTVREDGIEVRTYRVFMQSGKVVCHDRWIEYDKDSNPQLYVTDLYLQPEDI